MKKVKNNSLLTLICFLVLTSVVNVFDRIGAVDIAECPVDQYSLESISVNSVTKQAEYTVVKCYTTFSEANAALKAQSVNNPHLVVRHQNHTTPMKIMAQASGFAIATKGGSSATMTIDIFRNRELSTTGNNNWTTYTANYSNVYNGSKLYYFDSVINSKGVLVHRVSISGYEGYVRASETDLLPMIYVENKLPFVLKRGSTTQSYAKTDFNSYKVLDSGNGYNELYFFYQAVGTNGNWIGPYAVAPDWLKPGIPYYSLDGITFYTDPYFKNVVNNGSKFYNYYQYLPLRSKSNLTGAQLDNYLKALGRTTSIYYGKSQAFIDGQTKYGMNALLVYAMAGIESAFGTSTIARTKNNLFGWNAVDSAPGANASIYPSVEASILQQMGVNLFGYSNVADWRFTGPGLGNKGSGFNTKYASDPNWGLGIATVAYKTDKFNGFQDLNYYKLGVLNDRSNINVRAQASTSSVTYYNTRGSDKQLINQSVAVTNEKNNFYETIAWYPIVNGTVLTSHNKGNYTMDLNSNPGFIAKELITIVNNGKYNPQTPPVIGPDQPVDEVKPLENAKLYEVLATAGLRVRSAPSTSSAQLGLLAFQEQVEGVLQDGWIKIIHNEQYGYISAEFAKLVEELQPEPPIVEETNQTYMVNATGLRVRSEPNTSATVLGTLEYQSLVTGIVKDGWLKFTYNGKTAYTFAQYLKIVDTASLTIDELIKSVGSVVDSNILTGIKMNTSVEALTKAIKTKDANASVTVVGKDNKAKTGPVLTGDKLTVKSGTESKTVTIAIKGDVDGNGILNILDAREILLDINGHKKLQGAYNISAELTNDSSLNILDARQILLHINGHIDLTK